MLGSAAFLQDIVYRFFDLRIVCQRFKAEAGCAAEGQFLPDGLEQRLGIRELLLFAAGEGYPTYHRVFLSVHLLLAKIIAIEVPLILAGKGSTA